MNSINQQHRHHSGSVSASDKLSVGLLCANPKLMQWLQQLISFSRSPQLIPYEISSEALQQSGLPTSDLLIIDAEFALQQSRTLQLALGNVQQQISCLLVIQDEQLPSLMPQLAMLARNGVDQFVLHSDFNLRTIEELLSADSASQFGMMHSPVVEEQSTKPHLNTNRISEQTGTDIGLSVQRAQQPESSASTQLEHGVVHQLTIDLTNDRVHIDAVDMSPVCAEDDSLIKLESWLNRLSQESATRIKDLIDCAIHYEPIPRSLALEIQNSADELIGATLDDIQLKNNGQGRVIGASGTLHFSPHSSDLTQASVPDIRAGFDNLVESVDFIEAEKVWHNVTRSLPMQCLLLNEDGCIARVLNEGDLSNPCLPRVAEREPLSELLNIDSLDNLTETISRTLNTGKSHHQVIAYQSSQGLRWLDTHITRLRGDSGLARQVLWTAFDITNTRHAYQELLKSHDSIAQILEHAPVLFFQKDSAGRFLRANKLYCDVFGVNEQSIASHNDQEVFNDAHPNLQQITLDALAQSDSIEMMSRHYSETLGEKTVTLHWQTLLNKRSNDNQLDSLCGFGVILDDTAEQSGSPNEQHNSNQVAQLNPDSSLTMSGALQQDRQLIVDTLVKYAELAQQQKNATRTEHIADFLRQVETTAQSSRLQVSNSEVDNATGEPEKADDIVNSSNGSPKESGLALEPIIQDIIQSLGKKLPSSLTFTATPAARSSLARVDRDAFTQIARLLLEGASAPAEQEVNTDNKHQIALELKTIETEGLRCNACEEELSGEYLAVSVETFAPEIDSASLERLIESTRQNTRNNSDNHVVALTHRQQGHALIEKREHRFLLQLLFPKA